jgi:cytochrome c-type biogenesis protein
MSSISDFLSQLLTLEPGVMSVPQILGALLFAYLGGVLSSLTPCIYPMIPITMSVVGGAGPLRRSWSEVFLRASAYVFGMTLIYAFLGVLAGLTGRVFGSFSNTGFSYFALGTLLTFSALVMLDVIPFEPALWWERFKLRVWNRPGRSSAPKNLELEREVTVLSSFLLGASSGFIAAPCTTPVLTSILAYIAKTQSVGLGFGLMLAFSLGLGTLLILIAAFTGAVQLLPRSGHWMQLIKRVSGLILLGVAEYFIYRSGRLGGF